MNDYESLLSRKRHTLGNQGFEPVYIPDIAFDFQSHVIEKALVRGRNANFLDTGLGKTLIQLAIAENVIRKTNKKVLILTPLAVAFQFLVEAEKIGVGDIEYSKEGKHTKKIVICNYERLHYFDPSDFHCIILDESSVLKNHNSKTKEKVVSFCKKIAYRFLSTATPSPNDYIELGTSSEVLGHMGYMDMLGKFFRNNQNSVDSNNRNIGSKWYLKPHAQNDFFAWVNQWSIMVRKPSDIGFSDERYQLPELVTNTHTIKNQSLIDVNGQIQMFTPLAKTMTEVRHEQRMTELQRCQRAVELAKNKTSVYWCNTNKESSFLRQLDRNAVEIVGKMPIEQKEEILLAFSKGEIKRIVTKAGITGFGLNWQHCNHTVFFPTWSYEQYYQAIRRFWRFGQTQDVTVDLVISDGQKRVIDALKEKARKADELYTRLTESVNHSFNDVRKEFDKEIGLPSFL